MTAIRLEIILAAAHSKSDPIPAQMKREMRMAEIKIYVNEQLDGCTYQLAPRTKQMLQKRASPTKLVASVFVSLENEAQSNWTEGLLWQHVAEILTGLTTEQLKALGKIVFVDPKTKNVVFEPVEENV